MKKTNNYEDISVLIGNQIKKGLITNGFLNEKDLKIEISKGLVHYCEYAGGLFLLRDRGTHYILNYYINDITKKIAEIYHKDVVVEIVSRCNHKDNEIVKFFKKQNFEYCIERVRYIHACDKCVGDNVADNIELCKNDDLENVYRILKENFNIYTGCIPIKEKLIEDIKKRKIYIYRDKKIKGVLRISNNKFSSEIRQLVINKNERRKGIATRLVNKYFSDVDSKRRIVWTGKENIDARRFYEKIGYKPDGYISMIFIKKGFAK